MGHWEGGTGEGGSEAHTKHTFQKTVSSSQCQEFSPFGWFAFDSLLSQVSAGCLRAVSEQLQPRCSLTPICSIPGPGAEPSLC